MCMLLRAISLRQVDEERRVFELQQRMATWFLKQLKPAILMGASICAIPDSSVSAKKIFL